ncbi:putative ABC transport system ATP-binding protein [Actinacidiphila yanglinensis]|uniref:Putative ABC transport system ATP-binding protein n=1 Tax=Actinacidiphila yanglinensis TaxID=310779 RepID=A0A1H6AY08_9ACTN|nr:ABC transporter ATP-binding protein [Actinacidiphila yanglinensis]SEG53533.1 putative ABC transport system ATP-binding protein [Actinacidiphila yanglinensis]
MRGNGVGPRTAGTAGAGGSGREALRLSAVTKVYEGAGQPVTALDGVSLSLATGTFTSVMGPSGSGKSTLLQCAAGLDRPTAGRVLVGGDELPGGGEAELTRFRRSRIGFVFQDYNLVPYLTVAQNVALPQRLAGRRSRRGDVAAVLDRLGIGELAGRQPAELSGGQQQRVAIARALVSRPAVLFADEPTGALDTASGRQVLALLRESVEQFGQTVVMVTHDPVAAAYAGRVLFLADGALVDELPDPDAAEVARRMARLDAGAAGTGSGSGSDGNAEAVHVGSQAVA